MRKGRQGPHELLFIHQVNCQSRVVSHLPELLAAIAEAITGSIPAWGQVVAESFEDALESCTRVRPLLPWPQEIL